MKTTVNLLLLLLTITLHAQTRMSDPLVNPICRDSFRCPGKALGEAPDDPSAAKFALVIERERMADLKHLAKDIDRIANGNSHNDRQGILKHMKKQSAHVCQRDFCRVELGVEDLLLLDAFRKCSAGEQLDRLRGDIDQAQRALGNPKIIDVHVRTLVNRIREEISSL